MAQRYIYLSDELNNKLREEANASALISRLLIEHYQIKQPGHTKLQTFSDIVKMKSEELELAKKKLIEADGTEQEKRANEEEKQRKELEAWDEEKEISKRRIALRARYEKETPREKQSRDGWEEFYEKSLREIEHSGNGGETQAGADTSISDLTAPPT